MNTDAPKVTELNFKPSAAMEEVDKEQTKVDVNQAIDRRTSRYSYEDLINNQDWVLGGSPSTENSVGLGPINIFNLRRVLNLLIRTRRKDEERNPFKNNIGTSEIGRETKIESLVDLVFSKIKEDRS